MADQFLGEIRIFGGNFAPVGWALCDGQILTISQNTALFSLLGTFYGGNGTTNFALPNLQGAVPLGTGNGAGLTPRFPGETGGVETVTLLPSQLPVHTHSVTSAVSGATSHSPQGALPAIPAANPRFNSLYSPGPASAAEAGAAVSPAGSSFPHNNLQPYLVMSFIIALTGIYPPRS